VKWTNGDEVPTESLTAKKPTPAVAAAKPAAAAAGGGGGDLFAAIRVRPFARLKASIPRPSDLIASVCVCVCV
jgi:hypothetical protein